MKVNLNLVELFLEEEAYRVTSVTPVYRFKDGKRTDEVIGEQITLSGYFVALPDLDRLTVKLPIGAAELAGIEEGMRGTPKFTNLIGKFYSSQSGSYRNVLLSSTATSVQFEEA